MVKDVSAKLLQITETRQLARRGQIRERASVSREIITQQARAVSSLR
jgi:hypothetical protein